MTMALLTYRRDQAGFRPGMPCPDQLIGGILFCSSAAARAGWIRRLFASGRFNSFLCFRDVQSPYALQFGWAEWAAGRKVPFVQN